MSLNGSREGMQDISSILVKVLPVLGQLATIIGLVDSTSKDSPDTPIYYVIRKAVGM